MTVIVAVLAVAAGLATVWLPLPVWLLALYLCLVLLALTVLSAFGWWLKTGLAGPEDSVAWALASLGLCGAVLAASFLFGPGPGRFAPAEHVTIELPKWALSAAGLAAALACVGYGAVVTRAAGRWRAALGAMAIAVGVLTLQPVLRAFGLPHLGPVGSGVAVGLTLLAVLAPGWRRQKG
jgi:hypothetical protein